VPKQSRQLFSFFQLFLLIVGLGLIAFSILNFWEWYSRTQGTAKPPTAGETITHSTDRPDERSVPNDAVYNVPADQPKKIIISSIGVAGFIQPVGKDQYENIGVPTNIHFAGWYVKSVKPGEPGLSVIDGHVSSLYGAALFAKLKNLRQNDEVQIQFGDDSIRHFQVVEKRALSESQTGKFLLTKHDDIDKQLNLVTCGGAFNKISDKYNDRLVVVTKRIDNKLL
jgi:sortase (surface protein transpeptidase)